MNQKIIKQKIHDKLTEWIESISDSAVRDSVQDNVYTAGGCIASMLLKEEVKDYDVYFYKKACVKGLKDYYLKKYFAGKNVSETAIGRVLLRETKEKYEPVCVTSSAITLSNGIQIITKYCGTPDEVVDKFDFIHTKNYYVFKDSLLGLNNEALISLLCKRLMYTGPGEFPISSLLRMKKFIQRGWTISAGQILKICFKINALDLQDKEVFESQLIGVDVQLFNELLDHVSKNSSFDPAEIINKIDDIFED